MSLGDGVIQSIAGEWPVTAVSARRFALMIGIVFYVDWPDTTTLGGAALIIGADLWLWRRQGRRIGERRRDMFKLLKHMGL